MVNTTHKTNLKGPWYPVQPEECSGWWVVSTEPNGDGSVDESGDGGFEEETARFIAAAPELYEALVQLHAAQNGSPLEKPKAWEKAMRKTEAALAKIRGQA